MERLNEAMALVERQLEGEVDVRRASRIALMSEHHFRRMWLFTDEGVVAA